MKIERKILIAAIALAIFFACVAGFSIKQLSDTIANNKADKENAAKWKKQAGKAYTEMLKAKSGFKNIEVLVPKGARLQDGVIYPSEDF